MKMLFGIIGIVVLVAIWVRVAPNSIERWHIDPEAAEKPGVLGYRKELLVDKTPKEALRLLDNQILATPRTRVLTGSVESGRITYITRTKIWGFPDYTSISARASEGGTIVVALGRLRYGIGDSSVNWKRINGWLKVFEPIQQ